MKIVNLTPHPVTLVREDGTQVTFQPAGIVPRCTEVSVRVGELVVEDGSAVPVMRKQFGAVENLPAPQDGTYYIVSALVALACPERRDLLVPNDTVRDEQGRIVGCRNFATLAQP